MAQPPNQEHESLLLGKTQLNRHSPCELRNVGVTPGKLEVVLQQLQRRPLAVALEGLETDSEQVGVVGGPGVRLDQKGVSGRA